MVPSFAQLLANSGTSTITTDGQQPVTWEDLFQRAARKAGWMRRHLPEGTVGVVMNNELPAIEILVGAYLSGKGAVSLPLPHRGQHPNHYLDTLRSVTTAAMCGTVITPDTVNNPLSSGGQLTYTSIGDGPEYTEDSFIIQCSSGTTGEQKLVPLTTNQLEINLTEMRDALELGPHTTVASWLPLNHDMGLIGMLFISWIAGSHLRLSSPAQFLRNPMSWINDCHDTYLTGVPNFALDVVTTRMSRGHSPNSATNLKTLRHIILGGEPIQARSLLRFQQYLSPWGFKPEAYTPAYGMAELCLTVTCDPAWQAPKMFTSDGTVMGVFEPNFNPNTTGCVLLGKPLPSNQVTVDNTQRIVITSPALTEGYLGEPALNGRLVTEDNGVLVNNELGIYGRADDVIVVRGRKVWPETVEQAVGQLCDRPGGAVLVNADGMILIVAESVDTSSNHAALVRAASVSVTGVGPDIIVFTPPGSLPKTTSGKKKRHAVRNAYLEGTLPYQSAIHKVKTR